MSFDDNRRRLIAKYGAANRYANFGPVIQSIEVSGFRGIRDLNFALNAPVVALCGLNGTGKSTIAQLIACAYKSPSTATLRRYYVKNFFPVSAADPHPFTDNAKVIYTYQVQQDRDAQTVTVTRARKEWSGYKRQPERACYYIGFTQFIPKVERRDFSIYSGHLAQLVSTRPMEQQSAENVSSILGIPYQALSFAQLKHGKKGSELATAKAHDITYSENNMGFGEGRVVYMVRTMEEAPVQSLFVLEEPETSLHGEAQVRLAEYLIDVSLRRGHQIVLTTHSAAILQRLPSQSITYLRRHPDDRRLEAFPGLPAYQIDAYLRGVNAKRDRVICVEDYFAQTLLREVLRKDAQHLLAGSTILPVGNFDDVRNSVKLLREVQVKVVGITDADAQDDGSGGVFSFPGDAVAPEKAIFDHPKVRSLFVSNYGFDVSTVLTRCDHHEYAEEIAKSVYAAKDVICTEACRAYVEHAPSGTFTDVVKFIEDQLT